MGFVVTPSQDSEVGVREDLVLSYLISGPEITLTDGLSVLRTLLTSLGISYTLKPCEYSPGLPERTACIYVGNRDVGLVMEVRPDVITAFDLEYPVVVGEIRLNELSMLTREH